MAKSIRKEVSYFRPKKDIFKIQGVKRDYLTIPELMKAGYRQVKIKKRKLTAYAYEESTGKTEIGYFTNDPYSDLVLFIGCEWYSANDIRHAPVSYRIYSDGTMRVIPLK